MPPNNFILCHPLLLLPSILPSNRVFSNESVFLHQVAKGLELQHQSFQWIFRTYFLYDWLVWFPCSPRDSPIPQFKSINSSMLSFLYGPALTLWYNSYMTTGNTIALTIWVFVSKVMSLFFNMLSRFVIAFIPRSKHLLILWLKSPSTVILESKKIKSVTVSIVSVCICHEVMGLDAMILVFWMLSFKPA